jgi:S-adenosylmethionine hydrolase
VSAPVFLFTDFGSADMYVGQVKTVLHAAAPGSVVIDLLNDAPDFGVAAGAHLLAALAARLPPGSVTIAVVDPGVGTARGAVAVEAAGRWFVGPDNGLMSVVTGRATASCVYAVRAADGVSVSFHGRDVFAPAAAKIAAGDRSGLKLRDPLEVTLDAGDLPQVIYVDHYGNVVTGLRAGALDTSRALEIGGRRIAHGRVFGDVPQGTPFWYVNSIGLVEIAANRASAVAILRANVGDAVCPV